MYRMSPVKLENPCNLLHVLPSWCRCKQEVLLWNMKVSFTKQPWSGMGRELRNGATLWWK